MSWRFWRWRRSETNPAGFCRACQSELVTCESPPHGHRDYVHCFQGVSCPAHGRHWF